MAEEGHWETPSLAMQSMVPGMIHMHLQLVLEKQVGHMRVVAMMEEMSLL